MTKPIIINMAGGLGNQLFQLAAGIYIEENMGRSVKYNTSSLVKKTKSEIGNYTRSFELTHLIPEEKIVSKKIPARFNNLNFFLQKQFNSKALLVESGPLDNVLEKIEDKTKFLYGYFQNSKIVERTWPTMRKLITSSEKFRSVIETEKSDRIALHLRFGDYLNDPKTKAIHGLTKISYYVDAISNLRDLNKNINRLMIITDNSVQAQKFFSNFKTDLVVDFSPNKNSLINLSEIAKSSNVIMSNSTFSWWGAWFAYKEIGAKVIIPSPWYATSDHPEIPIYVNDWTKIKREFET